MIAEDGRYRFTPTTPGGTEIQGVGELWSLSRLVQANILRQAMERFDVTRGVSLAMLGFPRIGPDDLVRSETETPSSRLSDRDILACVLMGNLDLYPLHSIRNLGTDSLDCGIWDGEFGGPGYYYHQSNRGIGVINPGDPDCVREMWEGPLEIPRVRNMKDWHRHLRLEKMDDQDGCLMLEPGVAYLFGYWPAVSIWDLNISLETRSNFGRWALAGAVNSTTVHNPYNGVLTAEATTFAHRNMVLSTTWLPFQMGFEYVSPGLRRAAQLTFSGDPNQTLEAAAKDFQLHPERMLPRAAKRQKLYDRRKS